MLKPGSRLYTGAIVTRQFAEHYNALTARINSFAHAGRMVPAELINGRHHALVTFAIENRR